MARATRSAPPISAVTRSGGPARLPPQASGDPVSPFMELSRISLVRMLARTGSRKWETSLPWLQFMQAELIAEIPSRDTFARASRGWFTSVLHEIFPSLNEGLRERPVTREKPRPKQDLDAPWGQPNHVLGTLWTFRKNPALGGREVVYSEATWQRFLKALDDYPFAVIFQINELDGRGFPVHRGESSIAVKRDFDHPDWVRFTFTAHAADTGWPESAPIQDRWVAFVRGQVAEVNACAGGMTDDIGPGQTALERMTMNLSAGIADSRRVLRGYTWVTVLAEQLSERLGGEGALRASGAFRDVETLPNGSVWLRATPTINEFTNDKIRKVFDTLAPVLLTGLAISRFAAESYRAVEDVDASEYQ